MLGLAHTAVNLVDAGGEDSLKVPVLDHTVKCRFGNTQYGTDVSSDDAEIERVRNVVRQIIGGEGFGERVAFDEATVGKEGLYALQDEGNVLQDRGGKGEKENFRERPFEGEMQ